ncbi:hypothetical protein GCM10022409_04640 [Hymenobacter glaciei]|uniref:Uncharacterized protein n=1 Tax=Hymenobacter glaciei TaxID=877209 RepID=A0ABP7TBK6_9BACT
MSTDHIDDLFRSQLGDHETPPGDDLWARLQAGPSASAPAPLPSAHAPERVDQLYQHRLKVHATPVPRKIWERLEDEHLRPRKRRAAAWWPMALAAAVALLLLAGGAGLWLGFPTGSRGTAGTVASQPAGQPKAQEKLGNTTSNATIGTKSLEQNSQTASTSIITNGAATSIASAATQNGAQPSETAISSATQKNLPARATRSTGTASSASKVGMMAQQSPRRQQGASRQPDAATTSTPLVAGTTAPPSISTRPADESALASANLPAPTPTVENVPANPASSAVSPATLAAANIITVDVRNGAPRHPTLATAVATAAAATEDRPGLGGRLLRQVGHAVRGERISLSEVTGLPQNLTLEATIAGRHVSKSIQL